MRYLEQPQLDAFMDRGADKAAPKAIFNELTPGNSQLAVFFARVGDVFEFQAIEQAYQMNRSRSPRFRLQKFRRVCDEPVSAQRGLSGFARAV